MKIKNSYLKIILWILVGLVIGFIGGILGFMGIGKIRGAFSGIPELIIENIFWIQLVIAISLGGVSGYNLLKSAKLMKDFAEDDDVLEAKIDSKQNYALTFSTLNYIVSFMLFGVSVDPVNPLRFWSIGLFVLVILASTFMDVAVVNMVKRRDPMKKGDPGDMGFEKDWLESCDEAEKLMVYKAAYKAFNTTKYVLLSGLLLTFLSKLAFNTGNFPIIVVGIIWIIQTLSFTTYSMELQKNKLSM